MSDSFEVDRIEFEHGITAVIEADLDPLNPRTEYDNVGTMVCWHNRYNLGDEQPSYSPSEFWLRLCHELKLDTTCPVCEGTGQVYQAPESDRDAEPTDDDYCTCDCDDGEISSADAHKLAEEHVAILPLYLYDHGGITMSTGSFSCPWDSGQVGWIYTPKDRAIKEWGKDDWKSKALKYMEGEVETYDTYLTGEVYCINVTDADGETMDSCCGFFGLDYAREEANAMGEAAVKSRIRELEEERQRELKEAAEQQYWAERDVITEGS